MVEETEQIVIPKRLKKAPKRTIRILKFGYGSEILIDTKKFHILGRPVSIKRTDPVTRETITETRHVRASPPFYLPKDFDIGFRLPAKKAYIKIDETPIGPATTSVIFTNSDKFWGLCSRKKIPVDRLLIECGPRPTVPEPEPITPPPWLPQIRR